MVEAKKWRDAAVQEALKNVEAMKNECNGIAGSFCFLLYSNFLFADLLFGALSSSLS